MPGPGTLAIPTTFANAAGNVDTIPHLDACFVAIRDYLNPRVASSGLLANRAAAGNAGAIYYATDTGLTYLDTGAAWITIAGGVSLLDRDVSALEVAATVAETTLYSFTVPGGTLGSTKALRLNMLYDWLNTSGGALAVPRLRVKYGATTIADFSTFGAIASSAVRNGGRIEVILSALAATNAQVAGGSRREVQASVGGVDGADVVARTSLHNGIAEDSTANKDLVVTTTNPSADANYKTKALVVQLELL